MKRKSKRHDVKDTSEKSPEKPSRRSNRHSKRRRKSSSSSSSPEREKSDTKHKDSPVKDSPTKGNEKVRSYTPETVTENVSKEVVETKIIDQEAGNSRRSGKKHSGSEAETLKPVKKDEGGGDCEWKEDKSFWEGEVKVEEEADKGKEKEASVWKVQSANGAGGEIQKLKICRTRMPEMQEDSSPKRRSTRLKDTNQKGTGDECSSSNEDQANTENEKGSKHKHKSRTSSRSSPAIVDSPKVICDVSEDNPTKIKIHIETKSPEKVPLASPPIMHDKDISEVTAAVETITEVEEIQNVNSETVENTETKQANEVVQIKETTETQEVIEVEVGKIEDIELPPETTEKSKIEESEKEHQLPTPTDTIELPKEEEQDVSVTPETAEPVASEDNDESQPKESPSSNADSQVPERPSSTHSSSPRNEKAEEDKKDDASSSNNGGSSEDSDDSDSNESDSDSKKGKKKKRRKDGIQSTVMRQPTVKQKSPSPVKEDLRAEESSGKQEPEEELEEGEAPEEEDTDTKPNPITSDKENSAAAVDQSTVVPGPTEPVQRKRRWGASKTIRPPKKPVLCISTDSLKNLIPEAKPVPVEEVRLSVDDDIERELEISEREKSVEQLIPQEEIKISEKKEQKRERERDKHREKDKEKVKEEKPIKDKKETKSPGSEKASGDKVNRRVCVVSEDARKLVRSPSPARHRPSSVLFITNLVRPFTVPQLRNLLARTGKIADNGFWIDKIKSKCYVQYTDEAAAVETRHALHGVRWPVSNPRTLSVEFASYDDMAVAQALSEETEPIPRKAEPLQIDHSVEGWLAEQARVNAERSQRRVVREWDVGKPAHPDEELDFRPSRPYEDIRDRERERDRDRERRKKERSHRSRTPDLHEAPSRKARRKDEDAPAKLLDDLFRKTKMSPCIYWLPLTAEQIVVKEEMRRQHMAEHERRIAEMKKAEQARRDRDRDRRRK